MRDDEGKNELRFSIYLVRYIKSHKIHIFKHTKTYQIVIGWIFLPKNSAIKIKIYEECISNQPYQITLYLNKREHCSTSLILKTQFSVCIIFGKILTKTTRFFHYHSHSFDVCSRLVAFCWSWSSFHSLKILHLLHVR